MKKVLVLMAMAGFSFFVYECKKSTPASLADLTTDPITSVTATSAITGGDITFGGDATITERGVCWSTSPDPTISDSKTSDNNGTGMYISDITGLAANTTYHVRAYAENSAGTAYGNDITFTTGAPQLATLTTTPASTIAMNSAITGGDISSDGGAQVTERGVCYDTVAAPSLANPHTSNGTGTGSFNSDLAGLLSSKLYHVRAYATNSIGTAYGNEITFTTSGSQMSGSVTISGFAFSPSTLTVSVNTTVTWTNNDAVTHTVTSDSNVFNSGNLGQGQSYSYMFNTAGTYTYHCAIHPYMTGTIVVQ